MGSLVDGRFVVRPVIEVTLQEVRIVELASAVHRRGVATSSITCGSAIDGLPPTGASRRPVTTLLCSTAIPRCKQLGD
jgi:hypothetical protein